MWDVVSSFLNVVSVIASQKPDFGTPKVENAQFVGQNGKPPPRVRYRIVLAKLCHDQGHDLAHLT
jgi:hypothetical protein